jgi:uncharacterized OB-fold protein
MAIVTQARTAASMRQRPRSDGIDDAYWDALDEGRVVVQRCTGCSRRRWFPSPRCPHCGTAEHTWVEARDGKLHTWTTTHRQFHPAFPDVPFTVCVVELEGDDAVHIVARLEDDFDDAELSIDEPVRLEVVEDEAGNREVIARRGHDAKG